MDNIFELNVKIDDHDVEGLDIHTEKDFQIKDIEGNFEIEVIQKSSASRHKDGRTTKIRGFINADAEAVLEIRLPDRDEPIQIFTRTN